MTHPDTGSSRPNDQAFVPYDERIPIPDTMLPGEPHTCNGCPCFSCQVIGWHHGWGFGGCYLLGPYREEVPDMDEGYDDVGEGGCDCRCGTCENSDYHCHKRPRCKA